MCLTTTKTAQWTLESLSSPQTAPVCLTLRQKSGALSIMLIYVGIDDVQTSPVYIWPSFREKSCDCVKCHPCAINAIHFSSKKDFFQLDFWRLWRGWWWNNRNRRGHQAGWSHSQDQLILKVQSYLNVPPQTCPGDWTLHNGRSRSWTGGGSCLCQGYYWSEKLIYFQGLCWPEKSNIFKGIIGQRIV